MRVSKMTKYLFILSTVFSILSTQADELKVAVAANFKTTAQIIINNFSQQTSHKVTLITASSSALATQIYHGAPYDIFLSADQQRPMWLIKNNKAQASSLSKYAIGQLAFYSPEIKINSEKQFKNQLTSQTGKLAIANPKFAPYGKSSIDMLKKNNLYSLVSPKIVMGNNVIQALQFVQSGNAQSGLVSVSQLLELSTNEEYFIIPHHLYSPIAQYAVITNVGKDKKSAQQFLNFLTTRSETVILNNGYLTEVSND